MGFFACVNIGGRGGGFIAHKDWKTVRVGVSI